MRLGKYNCIRFGMVWLALGCSSGGQTDGADAGTNGNDSNYDLEMITSVFHT
jgi:hypothetical protein